MTLDDKERNEGRTLQVLIRAGNKTARWRRDQVKAGGLESGRGKMK